MLHIRIGLSAKIQLDLTTLSFNFGHKCPKRVYGKSQHHPTTEHKNLKTVSHYRMIA